MKSPAPTRSRAAAWAAAWAFLLAISAGDALARRHALLVGNNSGGEGVDSLRFAQTDARSFQDVLTRLAGFAAEDVQLLTDCDSAGLDGALKAMRTRASADDLFLRKRPQPAHIGNADPPSRLDLNGCVVADHEIDFVVGG